MIREKRTYSGNLLDVDFYPVFQNGKRIPSRAPKSIPSTEAQEKYNRAQAVKRLIRLVNANFDENDYLFHPTFVPERAPQSREELLKIVRSYRDRVKRTRLRELKKTQDALNALPETPELADEAERLKTKLEVLRRPMKYVYSPEQVRYKSGKCKGRVNWHIHMFITGGLDRKTMERLWGDDVCVNCNGFQPERFGPEAAAKYMLKGRGSKKKYIASRNLCEPVTPPPEKRDGKVSAYRLEKWAQQRVDDAAFWENRYKGYKFVRCFARKNPFNSRWYISLVMYRSGKTAPPWKTDEWGLDLWDT